MAGWLSLELFLKDAMSLYIAQQLKAGNMSPHGTFHYGISMRPQSPTAFYSLAAVGEHGPRASLCRVVSPAL